MEEEKLDKNSNSSHRKIGSGGEIELRRNLCAEMIQYLFVLSTERSANNCYCYSFNNNNNNNKLPKR